MKFHPVDSEAYLLVLAQISIEYCFVSPPDHVFACIACKITGLNRDTVAKNDCIV